MPTISVTINDEAFEAKLGERLFAVARRNGAHMGFVCDGNGVCQTCQCRVLGGAEHLSPPNDAETAWLSGAMLARGHRLGCQAALRGPGPVRVITNIEEFRRNLLAVAKDDDQLLIDRMEPLIEQVVRNSLNQVLRYPFNMLSTMVRLGPTRFLMPIQDPDRWVEDAQRVAERMRREREKRGS